MSPNAFVRKVDAGFVPPELRLNISLFGVGLLQFMAWKATIGIGHLPGAHGRGR